MKNRSEREDAGREGSEREEARGDQTHEQIFFLSFPEARHRGEPDRHGAHALWGNE